MSPAEEPSDYQLLKGFVQRDDTCCRQLVTRHKRFILTLLTNMGILLTDLHDRSQDVWLKLFTHFSNVPRTSLEPTSIRSYIATIVRSVVTDAHRKKSRTLPAAPEGLDTAQAPSPYVPELALADREQYLLWLSLIERHCGLNVRQWTEYRLSGCSSAEAASIVGEDPAVLSARFSYHRAAIAAAVLHRQKYDSA